MNIRLVICLLAFCPLIFAGFGDAPTPPAKREVIDRNLFTNEIAAAAGEEKAAIIRLQKSLEEMDKAVSEKETAVSEVTNERSKFVEAMKQANIALTEANKNHEADSARVHEASSKTSGSFWNKKRAINSAEVTEANKALAKAEKAVADAQKQHDENWPKFKIANEKFINANKALNEKRKELGGIKNSVNATKASQKAKEEQMASNIANLQAEIAGAAVGKKMSDLKSALKDTQLNQKVLEQVYNAGLVGQYMRAKLEGLLRDPGFCEAQKSCPNNSGVKANLENLFTAGKEGNRSESKGESPSQQGVSQERGTAPSHQ